MTDEKGLQLYKGEQFALFTPEGREAAEAIKDALVPGETMDVFDLPTITIPAGGGRAWDIPEGKPSETLTGVIILRQLVRAHWVEEFSGGGSPPDCSSNDSIIGVGDPGGRCAACPLAQFGSGKDNTQKCRQITRLFLLTKEGVMPTLVNLPPTSYKNSKLYNLNLASRHRRAYHSVVTTIGLEQDQSSGGIVYSKATFTVDSLLDLDAAKAISDIRESLMPTLEAVPIEEA